jgi:hypothetical protein
MPSADQRGGADAFQGALAVCRGEVDLDEDHPGHMANVAVRATDKLCGDGQEGRGS